MSTSIPKTEEEIQARRHRAIVEVPIGQIPALLGFPPDFKFIGVALDNELLRIKLQHPLFPAHKEGECITIIPLITK